MDNWEWRHRAKWLDTWRFTFSEGQPAMIDYEKMRSVSATKFEAYICRCTNPDYDYRGVRQCKKCNKIPTWKILLCVRCREPYIRDFRTREYDNFLPKDKLDPLCWDCNDQTVILPRQVVRTYSEAQLQELGIPVFTLE